MNTKERKRLARKDDEIRRIRTALVETESNYRRALTREHQIAGDLVDMKSKCIAFVDWKRSDSSDARWWELKLRFDDMELHVQNIDGETMRKHIHARVREAYYSALDDARRPMYVGGKGQVQP